jgi:hypothetical protein
VVIACAIFEKSSVCEKTRIQLQSGEPIGQSDPANVLHELFPFSSLIASIWIRFEFGPSVAEFTNATQVRCASETLRVVFDLRRM